MCTCERSSSIVSASVQHSRAPFQCNLHMQHNTSSIVQKMRDQTNGKSAAALRGAAEDAVAARKEIDSKEKYPGPPAVEGPAAVVGLESLEDRTDEQDQASTRRRNDSSCSGESACPPSKRAHTAGILVPS